MRYRSTPGPLILAAATSVSALLIGSPAHGAFISGLIDMNFNAVPGQSGESSTNNPVATGSAVLGSAGDYWNSQTLGTEPSAYSLLNTQSQATGVSITWVADGTWANGPTHDSTPLPNMMSTYLAAKTGSNATVTISGLSQDTDYTVIVYSQSYNSARNGTFTVSSDLTSSYQTISSDTYSTWVAGGNYLSFTTESDSNGNIVITDAVGTTSENDFNGFQITPAPEPASFAVFAGMTVLTLTRRRPRRST